MPVTSCRLTICTAIAIAFSPLPAAAQDAANHIHDSGSHTAQPGIIIPTEPGQGAFATIAEIAEILSNDPNTDWAKVDMQALREHLVDMNRVTLEAETQESPIEGGLEIIVSGQGRTLQSIQNMVIAHAPQLDQMDDWTASAEKLPNGARLWVTSADAGEIARIRGLGFFGLMASGAHHQPHHIGMAKGEMVHAQ